MTKHLHLIASAGSVVHINRGRVVGVTTADDFDESEHPRKSDGKFAPKGQGEAPANKGTPSLNQHMKAKLKAQGFEPTKSKAKNGATIYEHKATGIKVHASGHQAGSSSATGLWESNLEGKNAVRGIGSKELEKLMDRAPKAGYKPLTFQQAQAAHEASKKTEAPAAAPLKSPLTQMAETVKAKGYSYGGVKSINGKVFRIYANGDKVIALGIGADQGSWASQAPGFNTKTGSNFDELKTLLDGKPAGKNHGVNTSYEKALGGTSAPAPAAPPKSKTAEFLAQYEKNLAHTGEHYKKAASATPQPTPDQHKAIGVYTGSGYTAINGKLRSSRGKEVDAHAQHITAFLDKASFPETMVLRRGVKGSFAEAVMSIIDEGTVFIDHGFVSMSTGSGFHGEMSMHITVPKGSKAAGVSHIGGNVGEQEILAQRGSRFQVTKIQGKDIHVTLLPPKEKQQ